MATINLNSFPYYDDFDQTKKYLQMLFNPARAVQARELTQLQSILQNQVSNFGKSIYQQGSMVLPGSSAVNTSLPFLKLQPTYNSLPINVASFNSKIIVGLTSGTIASVITSLPADGSDPNTLYLKIQTGVSSQSLTGTINNGSNIISSISGSTTLLTAGALVSGTGIPANTFITEILSASSVSISNFATANTISLALVFSTGEAFINNETIATVVASPTPSVFALTALSSSTGLASSAQLQEGVYFVNGFFCFVSGDQPDGSQFLILDKYTNTPSYMIGLAIEDSIVTSATDSTLNDPANGFYNANAPGADRYKINLVLSKIALNTTITENFVQLISIKNGIIQSMVTRPAYSELEKTLARRTYDESGDYTVRYFPMSVQDVPNDSNGEATQFVAALEPGKAYVKGFEIQTYSTTYLPFDKARDTNTVTNNSLTFTLGNSVNVNHMRGTFNVTSNETLNLYGTIGGTGTVLGTAKIRGQEFITGTAGTIGAEYTIFLYDITMGVGNLFSNVKSIGTGITHCANPILISGQAIINNVDNDIALVPINEYAIKDFTNVSYTVRRYFSGVMTGASITINANTNELFDNGSGGFAEINYQVSILSASGAALGNGFVNGDNIDMTSGGNSIVLGGSPTGKQATITVAGIDGSTLAIIATVKKNPVSQKTKTLASNETLVFTTPSSGNLQLDKADIWKIISVTDNALSVDITSHYDFDNGQRDDYYNRGKLVFNTDYAPPTGNVTVVFNYFNHGVGDYFSVDSYNGVINYGQIEKYPSSTGTLYDLINTFDFRSRINNTGSGFSVLSEIPIPNSAILCSYERYLSRIDMIVLNPDGTFQVLTGSSGVSPTPPTPTSKCMVLYKLSIPPYTFNTKDVTYTLIDNKRYTMRDIGNLDTRISNLEYYTSLSLLEQSTSSLFIDDGTGNNRFKNGFIVDNFNSYSVGDVTNVDYKASLDTVVGALRPQFTQDNVGLSLDVTDSSNYTLTGTLITLPYTQESFINQPYASTQLNVNPYDIFNWVGVMTLTPSSDDWFDTTKAPDVIITQETGLDPALAAQVGNTQWNSWVNTWVGTSTSTSSGTPASFISYSNGQIIPNSAASANVFDLAFQQRYGRLPTALSITQGFLGSAHTTLATFTDITSTQQGQTRTGLQTTIATKVTSQTINENIVDKSSIPFIRAKDVTFSAVNMKPNTRVYPFFDNVGISAYVNGGSQLVTDAYGSVSGTFSIPNNSTISFRTGNRVFRLIDSSTNDTIAATTSSDTIYSATGILQTVQDTIVSTETAQLSQSAVSQDRVVVTATTSSTTQTLYVEPLAQSFLINSSGGVFLSKIDIFFFDKDPTTIPVQLQIRAMVNGVPTQTIIPFSTVVLNPSQVNTSVDGSAVTSFTFPSPVYLQDQVEYCFVLSSNSDQYRVWVSELGGIDSLTGSLISHSPYAGVLFESKNSSTWNAIQTEDIKFNIWRCAFNTATTANVVFNNDELSAKKLSNDPLTTTASSQVVGVYFPNHGLETGQKSTISGVTSAQNGIPLAELNGQHVITLVDIDNFTFTTSTTSASVTGACGGTTVFCDGNDIIDLTNINIQNIVFGDTTLNWGLKGTPLGEPLDTSFSNISVGYNLSFESPRIVYSSDNEGASKSFYVRAQMSTTNDALSPVLDISRSSAILIGNRINYDDTGENSTSGGNAIAKYVTKTVTLTTNATGIKVLLSAIRPAGADIEIYIKSLPAQSSDLFDNQDYVLVPPTDYPAFNNSTLFDYSFELQGLLPFSNFAIKILMLATDSSEVPIIQSFRGIATT